jgi:hypothetical protein
MKTNKKHKKILPEVHIFGDLQDARKLVTDFSKKKTKVVFRDGDLGKFYSGIKKDVNEILQDEIHKMEKDHRLIFVSFFPGQKKAEPLTEEKTDLHEPEMEESNNEGNMKAKNGKKEKKNTKVKKDKKKVNKEE